jgi:hypothetical protein
MGQLYMLPTYCIQAYVGNTVSFVLCFACFTIEERIISNWTHMVLKIDKDLYKSTDFCNGEATCSHGHEHKFLKSIFSIYTSSGYKHLIN